MGQKNYGAWKLERTTARLNWNDHAVVVDVGHPNRGFSLLKDDESVWGDLLQVAQISVARNETLDPYSRGTDLILRYPSSEKRRVGAELYWRWAECESTSEVDENEAEEADDDIDATTIGTIELIYSLETEFLDTEPDPEVVSQVQGSSIRQFGIAANGSLQELPTDETERAIALLVEQDGRQLLLAAIPSDVKSWEVSPVTSSAAATSAQSPNLHITCYLNSDFLEKGVIRRLRLFAAFGDCDCEQRLLAAATRFMESEIPLTA